jgi:hypothetical protein
MQIYIKTLNNTISLQVDSTYSINKLKKILCDREGIPITEQLLIFSGKQLEDKKTVAYYPIQRQSTLYLMRRLRGGAGNLTITFDDNFTLTISSSGVLTASVTGTYLNGPPDSGNFTLNNWLDTTTSEPVPGVSASFESAGTVNSGTFSITYTVTVTDIDFESYYKQLKRYAFFIESVAITITSQTSTLQKYLFIPNSSTNIQMTGNNIKHITTVDISSENKSIMLPPIATEGNSSIILHFKVTVITEPFILQIMPRITGEIPTVYTFYDTLPTFDSTIDFNTDPEAPTSSPIFKLDTINSVISLISNGSSDWKFLNYYTGTLTIDTRNSGTPLPASRFEITSQNIVLYYTDSIETICIFPSIESYYTIRYLTILNSTASSKTYTIYFTQYESVDGVSSSGYGWCYTTLTVSATSIRSIMFVRTPSGYLILGTAAYSGVTVDATTRSETAYTLLSKNITFAPFEVDVDRNYEVPAQPTLATGTSKLCIIKGRRNSAVFDNNIYTPSGTSSKIIFNGNNNTRISFDQQYSSALWLSVFYTTTTNILPINFYTGTGPDFTSYPVL